MYVYNKNVLEYAQIARSGPKSMIRNIEGRSIVYGFRTQQHSLQPYADKC